MIESIYAETFSERMDRARDQLDPERHAYASRYTVLPRCRVLLALSTGEVAKLWGVTEQQVRLLLARGLSPARNGHELERAALGKFQQNVGTTGLSGWNAIVANGGRVPRISRATPGRCRSR